jgi:hypothetical protein
VARTAYYQGGINAGWLTRNEAREAEGYDPIDGLDEPLRPLNMVEESDAADEMAEDDGGADDTAIPGETDDDASARRARHRARKVKAMRVAMENAASQRATALLHASAARLARRIAKDGKLPVADVISEALAIDTAAAQEWVDSTSASLTEPELIASLMTLGKTP